MEPRSSHGCQQEGDEMHLIAGLIALAQATISYGKAIVDAIGKTIGVL